jgi:hypothetical protein
MDALATIAGQLINRASGVSAILRNFPRTVGSDVGPAASGPGAFDETNDLRTRPTRDTLTGWIVMPV